MRRLALLVALAGCRQALGIPDEGQLDDGDELPLYDVTVVARGVAGASAAIDIDLERSDGTTEHVAVDDDKTLALKVRDGLGYTVGAPSICVVDNASGVIAGGPPALEVTIACDGLAALAAPGFSAPAALAFSSSGDTFTVHGSFLVQETSLSPTPRTPGGSIAVDVDGTVQTGMSGTWGPFAFVDGTTVTVTSSYPPAFERPYQFTFAAAMPAPFGYGKAMAPIGGARFGAALSADRDRLVVGAPGPADASAPGRAYVFRRTGRTWVEEAVLESPSPVDGDNFGASVAIRGERVVIGAPRAGDTAGSAYVFVPTSTGGWAGAAVAAPPGDGYGLGSAVAVEVDHILVGAPRTNSEAGAVYRYGLDGSNPQLFGAGTDAGDRYGASIAARNGTVVIGAPGESSSGSAPTDNSYPGAGAAYVYTAGIGSTPTYLKAPVPAPAAGDAFGTAVATDGAVVVVGAPFQDSGSPLATGIDPVGMVTDGAPQSGAAYMWRRVSSTWSFAHTLKAPNTDAGDGFGSSLALVRGVLAIGAPFEDSSVLDQSAADEGRRDAGAVYAYRVIAEDVTAAPAYIKATLPGFDDAFGSAVALSLESLIVGAPYDSSAATGWNGTAGDGAADSGAVSTYR